MIHSGAFSFNTDRNVRITAAGDRRVTGTGDVRTTGSLIAVSRMSLSGTLIPFSGQIYTVVDGPFEHLVLPLTPFVKVGAQLVEPTKVYVKTGGTLRRTR